MKTPLIARMAVLGALLQPTMAQAEDALVQSPISVVAVTQLDAVTTSFSPQNPSGLHIRRARIGFRALFSGVRISAVADLANSGPRIIFANLKWRGFTIGKHKIPFGLELTSPDFGLMFMERAAPVNSIPERGNWGVTYNYNGEDVDASTSVYSAGQSGSQFIVNEGVGYAGRLLLRRDLGASVDARLGVSAGIDLLSGAQTRTVRVRPESRWVPATLIVTLAGIERISRGGAELSLDVGRWSLQTEFLSAIYHRPGQESPTVYGAYGSVVWHPGEALREFRGGRFHAREARNAWAIAMRVGETNLGSLLEGPDHQRSLSVAWVYQVSPDVKIQLEGIHARTLPNGVSGSVLQARITLSLPN